ncbi:unnamed protein product [Brassicogethes aeneus]|uniref:USP domain-containing protein n=1 Tax=Brassicogethes aeneus TaxID=1431903 RepID=A0A9P0B1G5_BRAAE|nr:unnamed protein product [Brassicogethes aeneus]
MINKFRYKKPATKGDAVTSDKDFSDVKDTDKKDYTFSSHLNDEEKQKIKELFSQLQFSTETALPPDALRKALAESFFDQQRFQLGFMDDAAECFENMLLRIHTHIAHGEAEDMCNAKHCIPHQKFAMTLVEQNICKQCGASSEPLSYTQMVHYVSTSTLVYQVRNGRPPSDTFGQLLRRAGSMGDVRTCPSACGAVIQIGRNLMNHPEIVSVGLVWNSERPTLEHIMEVFSTIGTTLRLGDVFNTVVDTRWAETSMHNLVGVVTYYGKHYSTFFFHTKLRVWIYFDDATVREVGPRWEQVVEKCRKGRYQPLLLLYALPDGTPVNTENAPKQITPFYTEKVKKTPPQSVLRRSITPSPEKPTIGNNRRAITPNPDGSLNHKPPIPRAYNEYQNLSVIQKNLYGTQPNQDCDVVDGCLSRKEPEYITRKFLDFGHQKPQVNIHRTLSNGSSSGVEGMSIPDHMNVPRRRDSGNWSGDRNSASSASSTTMENPYLYLVGKVPHGGGSIPGSPTRTKSDSGGDAGYDSYSLSSNDSSTMSTLQHLMKMGHLAKIPEDYNNVQVQISQSCDVLCDEADELLVKSRQLEDEHDLVLALALCNAAATKARAAMNAPYNNPQTLTLARMKHNTCIMRARSLHRRMTQTQIPLSKETTPEIRHTREGSSGSGRHSRQNSRDKSSHSRQNSRELLVLEKEKPQMTKNIEIYATLPKKKDALKNKMNAFNIEDSEYMLYDKPPNRESRSIFSRNKNKDTQKSREKRSRSEDRNKMSRDFSIAPEILTGKDTLKKAKEDKEEKKDKDGKSKKQHKIRRKLLMGGLIKRKNRSMPDLTDTTVVNEPPTVTVDDSSLGLKGNLDSTSGMCGYLSEGHLEFTGNNANPNLERSKLMRKSFHCSAGKILTAAKVPPPPPLRTTSTLSKAKFNGGEVCNENVGERPKYPLPDDISYYDNQKVYANTNHYNQPHVSEYQNFDQHTYYGNNTVITRADVHQEKSPIKNIYDNGVNNIQVDSGVDEVDCLPSHSHANTLELPPYPSPMGSAIHSRQASEDFPPPPPPLDVSALDEHLPKPQKVEEPQPNSLLAQLQSKRREILSNELEVRKTTTEVKSSGDTWLRELQAKQASLRMKKSQDAKDVGVDVINTQRYLPGEKDNSIKSVRDLASKFETSESPTPKPTLNRVPSINFNLDVIKTESSPNTNVFNVKKREETHDTIPQEQIAQEIAEVERLSAAVNKTLNMNQDLPEDIRKPRQKKKSVSFCDQVILVATADEQEDDSYIPNPILERVLRTAMNKPETAAIRQEIIALRENEVQRNESLIQQESRACPEEVQYVQQPLYVRRNSVDNLLSRQNSIGSINDERSHAFSQPPLQSQPKVIPNDYNTENTQMHNGFMPSDSNPQYVEYGQYNGQTNNGINMNSYNNHFKEHDQYHNMQNGSPRQFNQQNNPPLVPNQNHNGPPLIVPNGQPRIQMHQQPSTQTAYRQSPYQPIPQNSPAYAAYYSQNRQQTSPQYRHTPPEFNNQQYSRVPYNHSPQVKQTTPSLLHHNGYGNQNGYQHPPSPSPSSVGSNYNYQQSMYRGLNNNFEGQQQRVPVPYEQTNGNYHSRQNDYDTQTNGPYQRLPQYHSDVYQRVPMPHQEQPPHDNYPVYQHALPSKQILKKTVSFEPGTKGGGAGEMQVPQMVPKAIVTPIVVNNANNCVPTDKTKCNLCRKKNVIAMNLYCTDCEFYMSRFTPRS